jgi:hypothetical protein
MLFLSTFIFLMYYLVFCLSNKSKIQDTLKIDQVIEVMVRSCSRWAVASLQDRSPLIAVLHANYAAGYLWALQDCFTDDQIHNATGIDIIKFQKSITRVQDISTRRLVSVCPGYASDLDSYLSKISGES